MTLRLKPITIAPLDDTSILLSNAFRSLHEIHRRHNYPALARAMALVREVQDELLVRHGTRCGDVALDRDMGARGI